MYWCAAQLQPQRDGLALNFLRQAGFETYAPRLRERRWAHGRAVVRTPLLFPGYAFVLIKLQWHTARWAPGVVRLIMHGVSPAVVPDAIIAALRARELGGLIELPRPPKFRPGDRVRVLHGPLAGHVGLYAGMKPRERVEVLLALLGGQQRVTLSQEDVETVCADGCRYRDAEPG
jgi:transcriptional antiterminator RfaH